MLSPSSVAHRRHRWHRHQLRPQQMEDSHSHVPSLPQLGQPAPRPLQCIDGRVHPTQRFLVHDRPTREGQHRHISVRQQNPMRRHVCCRCGSRAQSVRPPRAAAVMAEPPPPCGVLPFAISGKRTAAQRIFAVATWCRVGKNCRKAQLRRGYAAQSGTSAAILPRCHACQAIIFREKYSHIARLD